MPEAFVWPEGQVYIWTGTATASARVAYATDLDTKFKLEFINRRALDGTYYDLPGEERVDVTVGALFTVSTEIYRIFRSATAVHMHILHSAAPMGSAGYFLYSGRLTDVALKGSEGAAFNYSLTYYTNRWSAYGPP